jgi:hypothetical protein
MTADLTDEELIDRVLLIATYPIRSDLAELIRRYREATKVWSTGGSPVPPGKAETKLDCVHRGEHSVITSIRWRCTVCEPPVHAQAGPEGWRCATCGQVLR